MFQRDMSKPAVSLRIFPVLAAIFAVGIRPARADEPKEPAAAAALAEAAPKLPAAPPALAENLEGVFDEGYQSGPKRLQAAQKKIAAARTLAPDDPRLDYTHGLVLLKHGQTKQALVQFEAAAGRSGLAYWPAWQALIWAQLVDKQYDKGLKRLDEYAAIVRKAGDEANLTDRQRDAARWMGQILEGLDKSVAAKRLHELIDQHDARLHELLGDELYSMVEVGRDLVGERDAELSKQADASESVAEKNRSKRRQDQAGKLENDLKDLEKQKASATKSAEEWKEWLDGALEKIDKELAKLEKEYQTLDTRSETLRQTITQTGRDLTALELQLNSVATSGGTGTGIIQMQQQFLQRQNQLVNSQIEYNATIGRMSQTAQQGRVIMQQRAGIVQKYEKATGQIVKRNAEIEKWSARAADKKKKLDTSVTKGKGAKTAADRKTASLKAFVALDLHDEKARVLADFGISPDLPAETPAIETKK